MCGFVGLFTGPNGPPVDPALLERMNATLQHRGPDGHGVFAAGSVGLAHCRLRVIDTSDMADQPMFNEDQSVVVVFNGEVYNFQSLRDRLLDLGHRFETRSDTEVLVHGWEEWGEALPKKLDGMFAFAIYDNNQELIFVARDRFGKKPLYYAISDGTLLFASELKAIVAFPSFSRTLDPLSIHQYFAHDYVPTPNTIFQNAKKMPPATQMTVNTRAAITWPEPKRYWSLSFLPKRSLSFREATEEAERLLRTAVKRRLVSEVPLGVLLSGGLDSSAVLAEMRCVLPKADIQTFSIGFEDPSYDETTFARTVAQYFHTSHNEHVVTSGEALAHARVIQRNLDEPFADPSIIPTSILCRFAQEKVTVALGGDGGDELIAGYDPFLARGVFGSFGEAVRVLCPLLKSTLRYISASDRNMSIAFRIHHFLQGFPAKIRNGDIYRCALWMAPFSPDDQERIFHRDIPSYQELYHASTLVAKNSDARDAIDKLTAWFLGVYMHDNILVKVDRASMMHSLEVRSPFLDTVFAEFIARLPTAMKLRYLTTKRVLRSMMKNRLPASILSRHKKGFGMPISGWLRNEFSAQLQAVAAPDLLARQGLFNYEAIRKWICNHHNNVADHRKALWSFFMFQTWCETHGLLS